MNQKPLRLFVWTDVLQDYTAGMMMALAHDPEEARQTLIAAEPWVESDLGSAPEEWDLNGKPRCFVLAGGG